MPGVGSSHVTPRLSRLHLPRWPASRLAPRKGVWMTTRVARRKSTRSDAKSPADPNLPSGWQGTKPAHDVLTLDGVRAYVRDRQAGFDARHQPGPKSVKAVTEAERTEVLNAFRAALQVGFIQIHEMPSKELMDCDGIRAAWQDLAANYCLRRVDTQADRDRDKLPWHTREVKNIQQFLAWIDTMLDKISHDDPSVTWCHAYDQAELCIEKLELSDDAREALGKPIPKEASARDYRGTEINIPIWQSATRNRLSRLKQYLVDSAPSPPQTTGRLKVVSNARAAAKPKRKRGRRAIDPKADQKIWDAWQSKQYQDTSDLAMKMGGGLTGKKVAKIIDRHRKRLERQAETAVGK